MSVQKKEGQPFTVDIVVFRGWTEGWFYDFGKIG